MISLIFLYSWSPDGRKIAFWVTTGEYTDAYLYQLGILNLDTQKVILMNNVNSIRRTAVPLPLPIWSPDGRQILVRNGTEENDYHVLLIDLFQSIGYVMADDMVPLGWMAEDAQP